MNSGLVILAYLLGAIPFALLLSRRAGGGDVRYAGSGNIGTANVLRTAGMPTAVIVLALDMSKGAVTVILAQQLGAETTVVCAVAFAVIAGHVFPVWLGFRGGKGVATACGAFLILTPVATLFAVGLFAVVVLATRIISVGSMMASAALPLFAYVNDDPTIVLMSVSAVALLILYRHRANVRRLIAGCERRLG